MGPPGGASIAANVKLEMFDAKSHLISLSSYEKFRYVVYTRTLMKICR